MSDSYQAIYDAVRSRIGSADVGQIVRECCQMDASWAIDAVKNSFMEVAGAMQSPSVLYRPTLTIDGNQWCALYGEDLMNGVAGFGDSPCLAMADFDRNWWASLAKQQAEARATGATP